MNAPISTPPTPRRVLFVDDEPLILKALQRLMRRRTRWTPSFVESGEEALDALAAHPYDLLVSDMRMPGMSGAELLGEAQARFPDVLRIQLSGGSDAEQRFHAASVAHQFLAKPLRSESLDAVLARAEEMRALVKDDAVRHLVGASDQLPALPTVYAALTRVLGSDRSSFRDIAHVVGRDPSMCAQVLKLVNSAFFAAPKRVTNITEAVAFLGVRRVRDLVLMHGAFGQFRGRASRALPLAYLQRHALLTALIARHLDDTIDGDDASMAGMLHELGQFVLAARSPRYRDVLMAHDRPLHDVEQEVLHVSHAEVGAYVLGIWGLPYEVVRAVAYHHDPRRSGSTTFDLPAALYVADRLASEFSVGDDRTRRMDDQRIDLAFLESVGVAHRLDEWRRQAAALAERAGLGVPRPASVASVGPASSKGPTSAASSAATRSFVALASYDETLHHACSAALRDVAIVQRVLPFGPSLELGVLAPRCQVVLLPLHHSLRRGMDLLWRTRQENPGVPIVLLVQPHERDLADELVGDAVAGLVSLPLDPEALRACFARVAERGGNAARAPEPLATSAPRTPLQLIEPTTHVKKAAADAEADRRRCYRALVTPDHTLDVRARVGDASVPLTLHDISIATDDAPGGMLLSATMREAARLPFQEWLDGAPVRLRIALPDGGGPAILKARLVPPPRSHAGGGIRFAIQFSAAGPLASGIRAFWLRCQQRALARSA